MSETRDLVATDLVAQRSMHTENHRLTVLFGFAPDEHWLSVRSYNAIYLALRSNVDLI